MTDAFYCPHCGAPVPTAKRDEAFTQCDRCDGFLRWVDYETGARLEKPAAVPSVLKPIGERDTLTELPAADVEVDAEHEVSLAPPRLPALEPEPHDTDPAPPRRASARRVR